MSDLIFFNRTRSGSKNAREFLLTQKIDFVSHDVRKNPLDEQQTLELLKQKTDFYEKKGKKIIHIKSADKPSQDQLCKMFLGRSGTLRAPVLTKDNWIIAGFTEEIYSELIG